MTKRAVIVGLVMAIVVLVIIFILYTPEKTKSPTIYEQESTNAPTSDQTVQTNANESDDTADLEAELNAAGSELNSVDTEIDTSGL